MRTLPALVTLLLCTTGPAGASGRGIEKDLYLPYGPDVVLLPPPPLVPLPHGLLADQSPWVVVYLNFDGATLTPGGNNSKTNQTSLVLSTQSYPAMTWSGLGGKDAGIKAVVDQLKLLYMNYAVKLVTARPTSGDYTMAMIGGDGSGTAASSALGVAPLDCTNSNKNDVCLIFGAKVGASAKGLANVIAHEVGHTFGLEHVTDTKDIMAPALSSATCCWTSSSLAQGSTCGRTSQDAAAVLEKNLGKAKQDTLPPQVWFLRPGPGATLPPDFTFEVTAADDLAIHHVVVYFDGAKVLELSDLPYTKALTRIADGEHTLKAEVHDWASQKSTVEVTFRVDSKCVAEGTCAGGKGGPGAECSAGSDCASGLCATRQSEGRCAETCDGSATVPLCPKGLTCQSTGDSSWACVPGSGWAVQGSDEGGCTLGPRSTASGGDGWLGALLLGALVLSARRRRRAHPGARSRATPSAERAHPGLTSSPLRAMLGP